MGCATPDFRSVHERFRAPVMRYLARLVGEGEAEDLTQTVMLKVSRSLPDFRGESSVSTWIYRIATHVALDSLRRKGIATLSESDSAPDEGEVPAGAQAASVETAAIREEMNACIREFIERLPETYRTVMVLSELEGFRDREIAAILGLSLETVKIRLHRARGKLRKDLGAGCRFYRDADNDLACDRSPAGA